MSIVLSAVDVRISGCRIPFGSMRRRMTLAASVSSCDVMLLPWIGRAFSTTSSPPRRSRPRVNPRTATVTPAATISATTSARIDRLRRFSLKGSEV